MAARTARHLGAYQADLYAAEEETIARLGQRWGRLTAAQRYVDGLVDGEWFSERWGWFVRCGLERRGAGSRWSASAALDASGPDGRPTEGVILVADGALTQPVVLHELAHLVSPPGVGHGPPFAATLLELVRAEMGFLAYAELSHALAATPSFRESIGLVG